MNVIIGTRGSKLALAQAEYVKNRLQKHYPQNSYELKIISTKGDREQKKALDQIGDKGLFVREIEQELLDGTISLAVHSMKDMPAEQPSGLVFAHAWKREDPGCIDFAGSRFTGETSTACCDRHRKPKKGISASAASKGSAHYGNTRKCRYQNKKDAGRTTGRNCTRGGGTAPAGENFFDHAVF